MQIQDLIIIINLKVKEIQILIVSSTIIYKEQKNSNIASQSHEQVQGRFEIVT